MFEKSRILVVVFAAFFLSACGSTARFVEKPTLQIQGGSVSALDAVQQFFGGRSTPYEISFCEADSGTGECIDANAAPSATGLGGFFLPLELELKSVTVEQSSAKGDLIVLSTKLNAPVNDRQSSCGEVPATVEASATAATLRIPSNYCNWLVIGNVLQTATLSIDSIDLENGIFTGYYKIAFYGTGNARGSGYYQARYLISQPDARP